MPATRATAETPARVFWTAFIGLFFDYYDLYLFVYLDRVLAAHFALSAVQGDTAQFVGLAGVGVGALLFGALADRFGRGRVMLVVFGVYFAGVAGLGLAWSYGSLLSARLAASLALGAEWGISHAYLAERVEGATRYRFSALLQFSILGGLLAALAARHALPVVGWRGLFLASIVPVAILSVVRWRALAAAEPPPRVLGPPSMEGGSAGWRPFFLCLGVASLTIASGTVNIFYAKELPQGNLYLVLFWANIAPGLLAGAWIVRRLGVVRALLAYAVGLVVLSFWAWQADWPGRSLVFALLLPLLNGIPFGLMGAWFNEVMPRNRTMLSGGAYNLGRILAGAAPFLVTILGLHEGGRYFLFAAVLGLGVVALVFVARWAGLDRRPGTSAG